MTQKTLIAVNAVAGYSRLVVQLLVNLLLYPFVLSKVGTTDYGVYTVVMSLTGLATMLDIGISGAVVRFIAREDALQDHRACREVWLTALCAYSVPASIVLLILIPFSPWIARFFFPDPALYDTAVMLLILAALLFALGFPADAYRGVLRGQQRHFAVSTREALFDLLRAGLLVLVLSRWTASIRWVLVITAVTTVGCNVSLATLVHRSCAWARFRRDAVRWDRLRMILGFSVAVFIAQIGAALNLYLHRLILGRCIGPDAVTIYFFTATVLRENVENVVLHFTTALLPVAAKYQAQGEPVVLQSLLLRGTKYVVIVAGLIAAPLAAFAEPLLRIWLWRDPSFVQWAPLMVGTLTVTLIEATRGSSHVLLVGMARMRLLATVIVAAVLLDALLAITLIRTTNLGLYSVLVSSAAGVALRRTVIGWEACRAVGVSKRRFFSRSVLWPLLPAGVAFGVGKALQHVFVPHGWTALIASGTVAGLCGVLFCGFVTLNAFERSEVLAPALSAWRRLRPRRA